MKDDARQTLEFADYKVEMQRRIQGLEADNLWLRSEVERLTKGKVAINIPPSLDAADAASEVLIIAEAEDAAADLRAEERAEDKAEVEAKAHPAHPAKRGRRG